MTTTGLRRYLYRLYRTGNSLNGTSDPANGLGYVTLDSATDAGPYDGLLTVTGLGGTSGSFTVNNSLFPSGFTSFVLGFSATVGECQSRLLPVQPPGGRGRRRLVDRHGRYFEVGHADAGLHLRHAGSGAAAGRGLVAAVGPGGTRLSGAATQSRVERPSIRTQEPRCGGVLLAAVLTVSRPEPNSARRDLRS